MPVNSSTAIMRTSVELLDNNFYAYGDLYGGSNTIDKIQTNTTVLKSVGVRHSVNFTLTPPPADLDTNPAAVLPYYNLSNIIGFNTDVSGRSFVQINSKDGDFHIKFINNLETLTLTMSVFSTILNNQAPNNTDLNIEIANASNPNLQKTLELDILFLSSI